MNEEVTVHTEIKITRYMYGWSKYGGPTKGLVQEDKGDEWYCQGCTEKQTKELPSYMFEFINREFVRICSKCQSLVVQNHITSFDELCRLVRR